MTTFEIWSLIIETGVLGAVCRISFQMGRFTQKLADHLKSDEKAFEEIGKRLDRIEFPT